MHKSIRNTLSRRHVLKGAAVVPVVATPVPASAKSMGVSKRIGELFHVWQRAWLAHSEAVEVARTHEEDKFSSECAHAASDAWEALNKEPALSLQDIAAKGHAARIQWEGHGLDEEDLAPIWQDIDRLALVKEA